MFYGNLVFTTTQNLIQPAFSSSMSFLITDLSIPWVKANISRTPPSIQVSFLASFLNLFASFSRIFALPNPYTKVIKDQKRHSAHLWSVISAKKPPHAWCSCVVFVTLLKLSFTHPLANLQSKSLKSSSNKGLTEKHHPLFNGPAYGESS
jgi:hypothetical protein